MKTSSKDMSLLSAQAAEEATVDAHEVADKDLEDIVGGVDSLNSTNSPDAELPPLILNPF